MIKFLRNYLDYNKFEYFDDEHLQELIRAISVEFTRDGMNVKRILLDQAGMINTDAYYP